MMSAAPIPNTILAPSKAHSNKALIFKKTGFVASGSSDKFEINWVHTLMLTVSPIIAITGLITTKLNLMTFILAFLMYLWTGLGITAGYHRLWSHRAYSAHWLVRLALMLGGAGAFEGSAKWWCRNHRAHHRYTDTEKDPYNAKKGFWYAHMGWMLRKQDADKIGFADISDLNRDPMIQFQHKYYAPLSIGVGIVLPTLIGSLWGDALGAYFYAGVWKMVLVHHATFFVNSLAHTLGDKPFSDHHTAYDSFVTAILTLGEGYHNYHHEFPQDYRNGIEFYHYDPTKWLISFLHLFGLTYNLKSVPRHEIKKAQIQMSQRTLDRSMATIQHGKNFNRNLKDVTWEEIKERNQAGECLIVIGGFVIDVKNFVHEHPGGRQTLLNFVGTDATGLFNGEQNAHTHSQEARKFLFAMRVGQLKTKTN